MANLASEFDSLTANMDAMFQRFSDVISDVPSRFIQAPKRKKTPAIQFNNFYSELQNIIDSMGSMKNGANFDNLKNETNRLIREVLHEYSSPLFLFLSPSL